MTKQASGDSRGSFNNIDDLLAHGRHLADACNNWLAAKGINIPEADPWDDGMWASDLYLCGSHDGAE